MISRAFQIHSFDGQVRAEASDAEQAISLAITYGPNSAVRYLRREVFVMQKDLGESGSIANALEIMRDRIAWVDADMQGGRMD